MILRSRSILLSALGIAAVLQFSAVPALAIDDAPAKPKIDCSKPKNKTKPACKDKARPDAMSDDEIVNAGYWLSRDGKYAEALKLLAAAKDQGNHRVFDGDRVCNA